MIKELLDMEKLKAAYEELAAQRIYDLELQKQKLEEWRANEARYEELYQHIQSILIQVGQGQDELRELVELQMKQQFEMYTASYLLGLADIMQLPALILGTSTEAGTEVRDEKIS